MRYLMLESDKVSIALVQLMAFLFVAVGFIFLSAWAFKKGNKGKYLPLRIVVWAAAIIAFYFLYKWGTKVPDQN